MARTIRRGKDARGKITSESQKDVRSWHKRENKVARKSTNRANRHEVNMILNDTDDFEAVVIPDPLHTEGWVSY